MITKKIKITERRGGVKAILYCAALAAILFFSAPISAIEDDDNDVAYKGQLAPGMEVKLMGKKEAYKSVLPEGAIIRREGDVRVIEGVGEYAARRFVDYDARLAGMSAEIKSLREEVAAMRKEISGSKRSALVSVEK